MTDDDDDGYFNIIYIYGWVVCFCTYTVTDYSFRKDPNSFILFLRSSSYLDCL